jgi:uncharacterized protein (TIGR00297 family)
LFAAAVVSTAALRAHALSRGGALAATVLGGAVFAATGIRGGVTLVAFFLSSTLLGRLPTPRALEQRRGNERDAVQVLANGGIAAALSLASSVARRQVHPLWIAGFGGAVATATADTWATEIGSRSRTRPRSIVTLRIVAPGTSGAVTLTGLTASAAGAALIAGLTSARFGDTPGQIRSRAFPIVLGGFAGALADSVLGATLQEVRFCDACARETEQLTHGCGARTRPVRGASWCDNDTVNTIATALGAVMAAAIQFAEKSPASRPKW